MRPVSHSFGEVWKITSRHELYLPVIFNVSKKESVIDNSLPFFTCLTAANVFLGTLDWQWQIGHIQNNVYPVSYTNNKWFIYQLNKIGLK